MPELTELVARVRAGDGAGAAMVAAFRDTVVLVPQEESRTLAAGDAGGIRWLFAFTSEAELARWALARGADGASSQAYVSVLGRRLLRSGAGVALDVAGQAPMLLPPVRGIVPDELAVDA